MKKQLFTLLNCISAILLSFLYSHSMFAQTLYVPNATSGGIVDSNTTGVGIGTLNPTDQLEVVSGNRKVGINTLIPNVTNGGVLAISRGDDGNKILLIGTSAAPADDAVIWGAGGGSELRLVSGGLSSSGFGFYTNMSSTTAFGSTRPTPIMKLDGSGHVGIGTTDTRGFKLAVAGNIIAEEIVVKLQTNWPDYVFENNYKLPTLEELNTYIKVNKHLPEVPSACTVEEKGVNVGEMNMLLLKKIEELTLYIIELKKENEQQQNSIEELKKENKK